MRLTILLAFAAAGFGADCGTIGPQGPIDLPGHPFKIAISADGCRIFASLIKEGGDETSGIAVLRVAAGEVRLERTISLNQFTGIALTHDGKTLAVNGEDEVQFLEIAKLTEGNGNPVAWSVKTGADAGGIYINLTRDDKFAFVSEEASGAIAVIDIARRALVGKIRTGRAPIALTFSNDEKLLYTTSQAAQQEWNWPAVCDPENPRAKGGRHPEGAVLVVDVEKAKSDPAGALVSRARAGCNPVRLALSGDGSRAYVTARKSEAVLVFDAARLVSDPDHAQLASISVGTAPVPVAVAGGLVFAGNSNRFGTAGNGAQTVSVIDRTADRVIRSEQVGLFPRDLVVCPGGKALAVANYGSKSIQFISAK